jgi:predicted GNAT family acetyltransferase
MSDAAADPGSGHDELIVRDNPEERQYEAYVGPELAGVATYHAQQGLVTVMHTEIERAFEGRGIGSQFVAAMLDDIRRRQARVLPVCPFVRAFLQKHPEYADLVWAP